MLNSHFSSINDGANFWVGNKNFNTQAEFYIPSSQQPFGVDRSAMCFKTFVTKQLTKQNAQIKFIMCHILRVFQMCANRYIIMVKVRRPSIYSAFILSDRKREIEGSCLQRFTFHCAWMNYSLHI